MVEIRALNMDSKRYEKDHYSDSGMKFDRRHVSQNQHTSILSSFLLPDF